MNKYERGDTCTLELVNKSRKEDLDSVVMKLGKEIDGDILYVF